MIITPVTFDFIDKTPSGPDCSLHPGVQFGPYNFAFNQTKSQVVGVYSVDPSTDILSVVNTLSNGDQVRVTTDDTLPGGLDSGIFYYVISVTGTTLQLSLTSGGSAVNVLDAGFGTQTLIKRGIAFDLTGWSVWAWGKKTPEEPDQNILLDFGPMIVIPATNGVVQIKYDDAASASFLEHPTAFWDLIMADAAGERYGAYVRGKLAITYLVTHPP